MNVCGSCRWPDRSAFWVPYGTRLTRCPRMNFTEQSGYRKHLINARSHQCSEVLLPAIRGTTTGHTSPVPTGVSVSGSGDFASRGSAERDNNLIDWYEHRTGGHVAALDAPTEFVADNRWSVISALSSRPGRAVTRRADRGWTR